METQPTCEDPGSAPGSLGGWELLGCSSQASSCLPGLPFGGRYCSACLPLRKGAARRGSLWDEARGGVRRGRAAGEWACRVLFVTSCLCSDILLAVVHICCFWGRKNPEHKLV